MKLLQYLAIMALALGLSACGEDKTETVTLDPVAIHSGDECHVCGMIINQWAGPKGEVITAKTGQVMKFCSTTDMFSWVLQPENKNLNAAIYVHDMSQAHWDKPDDQYLIDARQAWYVMGSQRMGMGPTLASFANEAAAAEFAQQYGGKVLSFAQIDIDVLQAITRLGIEQMQDPNHHQSGMHH